MADNSSRTVFSGLIWRFSERCAAQGVTFIVSIILARLLDPEDYGTVALITVFTAVLQVFVNSGLGGALIQKKHADDLDFSSVFYFNLVMCTAMYLLMFWAAPFLAGFYGQPSLVPVIRVLSLIIVISGIKNIQQAYVSRHMLFKKFFFSTLGGTIGAAAAGIGMALLGYGVWALVCQMLLNALTDTVILWVTTGWHPKKMFSFARLKGLYSYGWKMLAASLLDTVYSNLSGLIIGKRYSSADLAYYNQGNRLPNLIVVNINSSIDSVLLPALSKEQDNKERLRAMTRRAMISSIYIMAPLMTGLACTAETVVRIVLTEKWLPCVPFLRIYCMAYLFYPVHTANLNAIAAQGRSDIFLRLEAAKKICGMAVLCSTMWISVRAMAYGMLVTGILSQAINAWPNKKLLDYRYLEQLKDIMPAVFLSAVMGICISFVPLAGLTDIVTLLLQVILGAAVYITGSVLLKLDAFVYLWKFIYPVISGISRKSRHDN